MPDRVLGLSLMIVGFAAAYLGYMYSISVPEPAPAPPAEEEEVSTISDIMDDPIMARIRRNDEPTAAEDGAGRTGSSSDSAAQPAEAPQPAVRLPEPREVQERRAEIVLKTGERFEDCVIHKVYPDGISFLHSGGGVRVAIEELPDELVQHFGLTVEEAEAYRKLEKESKTRLFEAVRESRIHRSERRRQALDEQQKMLPSEYRKVLRELDFEIRLLTSKLQVLESQMVYDAHTHEAWKRDLDDTRDRLASAQKRRNKLLAEYEALIN